MLETYEFRLLSRHRGLFLDLAGDRQLSGKDKTILRGVVGDEAYLRAGKIESELRASGKGGLIAGWDIKRKYSRDEVAKAELFYLKIPFTHLAGEEYGTQYQESTDCFRTAHTIEQLANGKRELVPIRVPCGICSKQAGLLHIPFEKLPKHRDIYRVWGGELIISEALSRLVLQNRLTGAAQFPICDVQGEQTSPVDLLNSPEGRALLTLALDRNLDPNMFEFWGWLYGEAPQDLVFGALASQEGDMNAEAQRTEPQRKFAQLIVRSNPISISKQSCFGENPFDKENNGQFECKGGKFAGNRPISGLYVAGKSWDGSDICISDVFVTRCQGLFRSHRLLLVSKNTLRSLREHDMKGFEFEIVTLV